MTARAPRSTPAGVATRAVGATDFYRAAMYASVAIGYLQGNFALRRPLVAADVRERPAGHWGCTPGIAFAWASLLQAVRLGTARIRLLVGTGHAGPVWLGCSLAEDAQPEWSGCGQGLSALAEVAAAYGASGGPPTELDAAYPGVMWASGELGHALGVAQGLSWAQDDRVVCVIGDGEVEAASTLGAMLCTELRPAPLVVLNDNGLRMGGRSELGQRCPEERDSLLRAFGQQVDRVALGDFEAMDRALRPALERDDPTLIAVDGMKGAGCPPLPDGHAIAGGTGAHKAPRPSRWDDAGLRWLEGWLRDLAPTWLPDVVDGAPSPLERWLPEPTMRLSSRPALTSKPSALHAPAEEERAVPGTARFVRCLAAQHRPHPILFTSPDELASNRLEALLAAPDVHVAEVLNEELCVAWAIGSAVGGRSAWHAGYEAFASLAVPLLVQHLKLLDGIAPARAPASIGIMLTSLGWRNVPSHRDSTVYSALLATRSRYLRMSFPVCGSTVDATIEAVAQARGEVHMVTTDKNVPLRPNWKAGPGGHDYGPHNVSDEVLLVIIGDVLAREAEHAVNELIRAGVPARAVAVEELTSLYRRDEQAAEVRGWLARQRAASASTYVVAAGAGELASRLLVEALGGEVRVLGPASWSAVGRPGVDVLLRDRCVWFELVRQVADDFAGQVDDERAVRLKLLSARARAQVDDVVEGFRQHDPDDWHSPLEG